MMTSDDMRTQCIATTRSGEQCKNSALADSEYCRAHQPENGQADAGSEPADAQSRQQLAAELDELMAKVKGMTSDYTPPPFSARRLISLLEENLDKFTPELRISILEKLRKAIAEDLFDADTWKGIWVVLNYTVEYQADILKRRMTGEYETDEWGLDHEFLDSARPFFEFLYKKYWRVKTTGLENVPGEGRGLLVSNHSGQLPWDGAMIATSILVDHPSARLVRSLYGDWFPTLPFISVMFTKLGQVLATDENGIRLLQQDELVAVFPEGYKGVGKLYKERYRLGRFGRGGFIRMALSTGAPIIPVSVVGAEESYISLYKSPTLAKATGFPYFPISPTFPWLGPLGLIPLPTQWYIDFGQPIPTDSYEADAANNPMLVSQLTDQVRNVVQEMVFARLAKRPSVFFA